MKRKIENILREWRLSGSNKALMIEGARQVGKTYLLKSFAKKEFENLLYINFEDQRRLRELFSNCDNPEKAITLLQTFAISQNIFTLDKEKTIIFFDEIQLCKRAYSLLKPLCELNQFRIVASESLLGVNLGGDYLDPGPLVIHQTMYPMDFEEYLWSKNIPLNLIEEIKSNLRKGILIEESLHQYLNSLLLEYIVIGGMPQAIATFNETKDYAKVYIEQESIIKLYRNDIQQYQKDNDLKVKIINCFNSIPRQFSKDSHKFQYKIIKEGGNARYFGSAIDWIILTGNAHKCHLVKHISGSLIDGQSTEFKLYLNDIGLLICMLGKEYIYRILNNELGLFKGAIYEQLLAQILIAKKHPLYYMTPNRYEIDFLIEKEGNIFPIECKSSGNTKSKSLLAYVREFSPKKAFKVSLNNVNLSNSIIKHYPLYGVALLEEII